MSASLLLSRGPVAMGAIEFEDPPRATLGCIQLPTDLTLDEEGPRLVSRMPGVRLRLQKLELDGESLDLSNYATARGRVARAAAMLRPADSLDAVGLSCTSLAFTLGCDQVQRELRVAHPGAKVTDMATATLAALDQLGIERLALVTPYIGELHERNLEFLVDNDREVVSEYNLGLRTDEAISSISKRSIRELVHSVDHAEAEAVLIGCSAFRVCTPGFLTELENELHKPVLCSQQAFLWHLLRLAGVDDTVGGYGALFAKPVQKSRRVAPKPVEHEFDFYPSRVAEPTLVERVDPVVCSDRRDSGPLPASAVDEFEARGVLALRQVFDPIEVGALRRTVTALRDHYESLSYEELDHGTDMRVISERGGALAQKTGDSPILKSIWQIHLPPEHAPHMLFAADMTRRAICDERLVEPLRQLVGDELYVHQSRINFQRGIEEHSLGGTGFSWHQDFEQWHCEDGMPRMRAISAAILLERAVPANGALMVMPGSHKRLLQARRGDDQEQGYAKGALSSGPQLPIDRLHMLADEHGIEHCAGEPGDVILFDCNTIHGSHTNISPWGRCMLFAVYNSVANVPLSRPFVGKELRPEHIGSHDPRFAGVPLPSEQHSLTEFVPVLAGRP